MPRRVKKFSNAILMKLERQPWKDNLKFVDLPLKHGKRFIPLDHQNTILSVYPRYLVPSIALS